MIHVVNFGSAKGGLATIGYRLYSPNGSAYGARQTSGVVEIGTTTGIYAADIGFPDEWDGVILWDTGEASPRYAVEQYRALLTKIHGETDDIRKIWNSMRNQGLLYQKLLTALGKLEIKGKEKGKDYSKDFDNMIDLLKDAIKKEYPTLKQIKESLIIPAPIIKIPETKIPDYSKILLKVEQALGSIIFEVNKIPKEHKDYTNNLSSLTQQLENLFKDLGSKTSDIIATLDNKIKETAKTTEVKSQTGSLLYELNNLKTEIKKTIEIAQEKIEKVDRNIIDTMKPAKFLQDIYEILKQSQDLKVLTDDYKKKMESLKLAGVFLNGKD